MTNAVRVVLAAMSCAAFFSLVGCGATPVGADENGAALDRALTLLQVHATGPDPATRANCVEAMQPSQDPRAAAVIEQGLHDREWVVRFASAMAVGKRKSAQYKLVLADMATKDSNDSVRAAAIYALRQCGDSANMNALPKMLVSPDVSVRANAAFVLGLIGDKSAIGLLEATSKETDPRVKFEIAAALARLGSKNAQRIIIAQALSKFAEDQWIAMIVCADLPVDMAANPLLMGLKEGPSQTPTELRPLTVRRQLVAARSLGKLGSTQGKELALTHLKNPDTQLRALAALALGDILMPAEEQPLIELMGDPDVGVERAAAAAIVAIQSRR